MRPLPSIYTLLSSCRTLRSLKEIHTHIILNQFQQHPFFISRFLVLCNSFSALDYAVSVFNRVSEPNLYLYNALLKAHCDHGSPLSESFSLFNLLLNTCPLLPDGYTFTSLLKSCSDAGNLSLGSSLHCCIVRCGLDSDVYLQAKLVDFYGKCRQLDDARKVFDAMPDGNVVSWTSMLVGYLSFGDLSSARKLFDEMPIRNVVTWNAMIDGYVKVRDMVNARSLFDDMTEKNSVTFTSMIDGYAKIGDMTTARSIFELGKDHRDVFSWSSILSGYAQNGHPAEAIKIFLEMYGNNIKPDEHILVGLMSACSQLGGLSFAKWVDSYITRSKIDVKRTHVSAALINMNAKCGNMERAAHLFESLRSRDLFMYCSMMQGYSLHGCGDKAVGLFSRMLKEGVLPDGVAFTVILNACSHAGLVEEGKHYFEMMKNEYMIEPSQDHYACMVDLLGRAGHLKEADEVIQRMPMEPHAGVLGALLGACRIHCDSELGELTAQKLFEIEPHSTVTYKEDKGLGVSEKSCLVTSPSDR
ncbi:putative pentatricopeptide repeat-containing protein At5g37570 isoform X1 [Asparagus officinalis]|uniref:putative pentatricopeptide repeat-containing protein At5g37570 isoform X1 n=1 Tax=Asparagus officinalis TaxID=4686 RepID=UPI00098E76EF|nr:putative pentatricopeptide repeat-containing protein At5g37570 isoform X1 [Asparagus officinalis]